MGAHIREKEVLSPEEQAEKARQVAEQQRLKAISDVVNAPPLTIT